LSRRVHIAEAGLGLGIALFGKRLEFNQRRGKVAAMISVDSGINILRRQRRGDCENKTTSAALRAFCMPALPFTPL